MAFAGAGAAGVIPRNNTDVAAELARLRRRVMALEAALTPSTFTKQALIGEFRIPVTVYDDDGGETTTMVTVPWTTTKEIMAAIRELADGGAR